MKRSVRLGLAVCFSVETVAGNFLTDAWTSREMMHVGTWMLAAGALGLLVSLVALVERPSATGGRCPH